MRTLYVAVGAGIIVTVVGGLVLYGLADRVAPQGAAKTREFKTSREAERVCGGTYSLNYTAERGYAVFVCPKNSN